MSIHYRSAATVDISALTVAFNIAYDDYFVPMRLTEKQLLQSHRQTSVDIQASLVAIDAERVVGLGFLAHRDKRGWIAGIGVIPAYRRQGIARQIVQNLLQTAREQSIRTVSLEVIEDNVPAQCLYKELGFEVKRRLLIVGCEELPPLHTTECTLKKVFGADALTHYRDFHHVPNPWQRQQESLEYMVASMNGWVSLQDGKPAAYAIGYEWDDVVTLVDVGFAPGADENFAGLLVALHHQYPQTIIRMTNLTEDDPAWPIMRSLGYEEKLAQYEMTIALM